jgi:uncharacterized protein
MRLDLSGALKDPGQSYPFDCPIELAEMTVLSDPVRFDAVRMHGAAVGTGEAVSIEGGVDAVVHSRCARCLCDVRFPVNARFKQVFSRDPAPAGDALPLDAAGAELNPIAAEALLLELPMRFLCKADCLGLCPVCGKNRNEERCRCQEGGERRNPFSALSDLLTEDEEV